MTCPLETYRQRIGIFNRCNLTRLNTKKHCVTKNSKESSRAVYIILLYGFSLLNIVLLSQPTSSPQLVSLSLSPGISDANNHNNLLICACSADVIFNHDKQKIFDSPKGKIFFLVIWQIFPATKFINFHILVLSTTS